MRAGFVDKCDPRAHAPSERVTQARGELESRSATSDNDDLMKWRVF
jgi:hypothetical protein